jgi:phosphoribosylaminoimidazole (AIR) synthetase
MNDYTTIGQDLVAMCVNDVLCHGAQPLAFLDYYVTGKLNVSRARTVIDSIARACRDADCALIGRCFAMLTLSSTHTGGETAEMPGVYGVNQWDVAGFVVGCVDTVKQPLLPIVDKCVYFFVRTHLPRMRAGQLCVCLPSTGVHSNGFSLVRRVVNELKLDYNQPCPWDVQQALGG